MKEGQMTDNDERRPIAPPSRQRPGPDAPVPGAAKAKSGGGKNKKMANGIVALGSAAIISVYGLGYARTQSAAAYLNADSPATMIATAAYQSPLLTPSATAIAPSATTIAPSATATGAASLPTTAPSTATTVPLPATKAPATATAATTAAYKDGTYTGTGTSRHGSITASVVVQGGKIVSANITQCGTRYPCSDIATLPGQVVTRQSATVDFVSGATDSSQAFQGAIKNALGRAKA
jgi:uncharacterized protein with FMN-binding domain